MAHAFRHDSTNNDKSLHDFLILIIPIDYRYIVSLVCQIDKARCSFDLGHSSLGVEVSEPYKRIYQTEFERRERSCCIQVIAIAPPAENGYLPQGHC